MKCIVCGIDIDLEKLDQKDGVRMVFGYCPKCKQKWRIEFHAVKS